MTTEGLLSVRGDVAILVAAQESFIISDLVRASKESSGLEETLTMDIDGNGKVDILDIAFIKKELFTSF